MRWAEALLIEGALLAFRDADVAIDAVLFDDLGVILGAVVGLFNALVGAHVSAFEAGVTFFHINGHGHDSDSKKRTYESHNKGVRVKRSPLYNLNPYMSDGYIPSWALLYWA